ncbi:unnamed protein product [Adineta steineri]|uniref:Uncharacterized protein n=1 Tax=Adineta steineri TaxID=433720 RepID=A0A815UFD9_9BILA|nr:unnamed protein product [Adineta steineri]CAF1375456.1 unnamed protein product [Adineta steineri]CAF1519092.1 unnamed protein product [Adineta steineri]CAF1605523.1 unnamed protein product [Adineta steineri]
MWYIWIFIYSILIKLSSSLPTTTTSNEFYDYQQNRLLQSADPTNQSVSSNICSLQSINIDTRASDTNTFGFTSSWQLNTVENTSNSTILNIIQIIFTIPYTISNNSIFNKTVFITDVVHNQLLASLTNICINGSSFIINYSTTISLPHNICLYLLLNLTSSTVLKEIIFCRTIDYSYNDTSSTDNSQTDTNQSVGPSVYFIISQSIIILIMMFTIYAVQTVRKKSLLNRIGQLVIRSRPYKTIFGHKTDVRNDNNTDNIPINSANALQVGLNQIVLHRSLASIPSLHLTIPTPTEEQVLAANDLTSTIYDRRMSRPFINRDLIDVKEFTKRISTPNESSTDIQ